MLCQNNHQDAACSHSILAIKPTIPADPPCTLKKQQPQLGLHTPAQQQKPCKVMDPAYASHGEAKFAAVAAAAAAAAVAAAAAAAAAFALRLLRVLMLPPSLLPLLLPPRLSPCVLLRVPLPAAPSPRQQAQQPTTHRPCAAVPAGPKTEQGMCNMSCARMLTEESSNSSAGPSW
jgi:hypothetical protein